MKTRLITKFILIYIFIGIVSFVLVSTLGSSLVERGLSDSEGRRLYLEASRIADTQNLQLIRDEAAMSGLYENLCALAAYQNADIWLISSDGNLFLNTGSPFHPTNPDRIASFDPIVLGSGFYSIGTFFDYYPSDRLSVMVPITASLDIRGYVAIHAPMDDIYRRRENILAVIHILCILMFLIFLSVFILLYLTVLQPLKKITEGAREYAAGHLDYNIAVRSSDEMGSLASSLNYMSKELSQSGEYQRRFIANVSHDFRSPLTSIKGFVEALLDGTIPVEMEDKYLRIVLAETERLTKLTNGILTLNRIDRGINNLSITDFDINAVIQDTAAAFEGICTPRKISIELLLTGEKLYVSADLGKIQQVLYNLIDNAVKFSRDNSVISIETDVRHNKVFVSVKDQGIGIPSSSLGKIWDRFYKTDVSRGREPKGNGLGLSIVREIINQHNQNITVISTEGVGTEFIFSLDPGKPPKE